MTTTEPGIEIVSTTFYIYHGSNAGSAPKAKGNIQQGIQYTLEIFAKVKSGYSIDGIGREEITIDGKKPSYYKAPSSDGASMRIYHYLPRFEGEPASYKIQTTNASVKDAKGLKVTSSITGRKYQLWAIQASTNDSGGALVYSESIDGKNWLPFVNCTFDGAPELQKVWHGAVSRDNLYRFVFVEDSGKSKEILYTESADGTTWQEPRAIIQKKNFWAAFYRPCILYSNSNFYCIYGVITRDNEWYLSMSTGISPDGLRGISSQELGASEINS